MKFMTVIGLSLLAFNCFAQNNLCDYYAPQCPEKYDKYIDGLDALNLRVKNKLLTKEQASYQVTLMAQEMYPKDGLLRSITQQRLIVESMPVSPALSEQQKKDLIQSAVNTATYALEERWALLRAAQDIAATRNTSSSQTVYVTGGNQGLNDAIPTALFLNKVGNAFATSFGQNIMPMTTCNSWGAAGVKCY